jgi:hypothetical protein
MRLIQTYHISGKPATTTKAVILSDILKRESDADISRLNKYLEGHMAEKVGSHPNREPLFSDFPYSHFARLTNETDYYHMGNLTLKVEARAYGKDWVVEGEHMNLPQGLELKIDIFGEGSERMRENLRKNVFGNKNRKVIKE